MAVRANDGAPGIDKTTLAEIGQYGAARLLGELADELRQRSWRPVPARRVFIPKDVDFVLGVVDLGQRGLGTWMRRLRQGGKDVGGDVEPAPLLDGVGEHLT